MNKSLKKALLCIKKNENSYTAGEKDKSLVSKAEEKLDVFLPTSYKEFLVTVGCVDVNSIAFYGLTNDTFEDIKVTNGISLTLQERQRSNIDKNFILICKSVDYYYALDTSQMIKGECPVVEVLPIDGGKINLVVAPTFGDFMYRMIKRELYKEYFFDKGIECKMASGISFFAFFILAIIVDILIPIDLLSDAYYPYVIIPGILVSLVGGNLLNRNYDRDDNNDIYGYIIGIVELIILVALALFLSKLEGNW